MLSGGVVLAGGGGVDDIDELSPLGEVDGEVDCCFEQAARASNALRHTNIMLRFIGSPHCGSADQNAWEAWGVPYRR